MKKKSKKISKSVVNKSEPLISSRIEIPGLFGGGKIRRELAPDSDNGIKDNKGKSDAVVKKVGAA